MRCLALCAQPLTLSSVALVELLLGPPVLLATWSSIWHRSADVLPLPPRPMLLLVLLGAPFSSASTLQTGLSGPSYMLGRCSVGLFLRSRSKRDAAFDMISKVWQPIILMSIFDCFLRKKKIKEPEKYRGEIEESRKFYSGW